MGRWEQKLIHSTPAQLTWIFSHSAIAKLYMSFQHRPMGYLLHLIWRHNCLAVNHCSYLWMVWNY